LVARDLVHGSIAALIAERRAIHETDWPNDLLSRLMEARDSDTPKSLRGCTRNSTQSSETMHQLSRNCITSPTRFRS